MMIAARHETVKAIGLAKGALIDWMQRLKRGRGGLALECRTEKYLRGVQK